MRNLPETFEELLDRPYRWPKKGDRLLRKTDDWNTGAGFSKDGISRHVHIWDGYMIRARGRDVSIKRRAKRRGPKRSLFLSKFYRVGGHLNILMISSCFSSGMTSWINSLRSSGLGSHRLAPTSSTQVFWSFGFAARMMPTP
jgi:hypothetical protein